MRIYIIGMMLSGKTTVGKQLARRLNYHFYDTDLLIEKKNRMKITQIVKKKGLPYFRHLESKTLKQLTKDNIVISTGGGIILDEENVTFMKENGLVIYLRQPIKKLERRLSSFNKKKRPLLLRNSLQEIYEKRKELYMQAATLTIDCEHDNSHEITKKLIDIIKNSRF